jgi:hypothetical protein
LKKKNSPDVSPEHQGNIGTDFSPYVGGGNPDDVLDVPWEKPQAQKPKKQKNKKIRLFPRCPPWKRMTSPPNRKTTPPRPSRCSLLMVHRQRTAGGKQAFHRSEALAGQLGIAAEFGQAVRELSPLKVVAV